MLSSNIRSDSKCTRVCSTTTTFRQLGVCVTIVLLVLNVIYFRHMRPPPPYVHDNDPPITLSIGDELPPMVYTEPVCGAVCRLRIKDLVKLVIGHLDANDIEYQVAFGSLIGSVRNGIMLLPWDDDIDLIISADSEDKFFSSLEAFDHTGYGMWLVHLRNFLRPFAWRNWISDTWYRLELPDGLIEVNRKRLGPAIKVWQGGAFVDVYVADLRNGQFSIADSQTYSGHIHGFSHPYDTVFPLREVEVPFTGEGDDSEPFGLGELMRVYIPNKPDIMLKKDYGPTVMEECQSTYNHHHSEFAKVFFPCILLPERFRPALS